MQRFFFFLLCATFFIFFSLSANAQATLSGTVRDSKTGEVLFAANVVVLQNDKITTGAETDFEGNFSMTGLDAGEYDVRCTYTGMKEVLIKIILEVEKINYLNIEMEEGPGFKVGGCGGYRNPLIDFDNTTAGQRWTGREVSRLPIR